MKKHTILGKGIRILLRLLFLLSLILAFGLTWAMRNFGNVTLEQVIFLISVPMEGVSSELVFDFLKTALIPSFAIFAVAMALVCLPRKKSLQLAFGKLEEGTEEAESKETEAAEAAENAETEESRAAGAGNQKKAPKKYQLLPLRVSNGFLAFVVFCSLLHTAIRADEAFSVVDYVRASMQTSTLIEEEYVYPGDVQITFPEKKKNLICIYIESGETSSQDVANGGIKELNYTPELTELAKNNLTFSQSEKIEGSSCAPNCGWTIAGLCAMTAGVPLAIPQQNRNSMSRFDSFLPGVMSLGEILQDNGYKNYFMAGSDFTFGGRREYFTSHGNYTIYDYVWAKKEGLIPKDYKVFWGLEDQKLFSYAKTELTKIAQKDEPFNFSILTVDTHTPDGYICDLCESKYPPQYANVWACASKQISEFVSWIQEQDFYEDTVIFLSGDHPSMNVTFYGADTVDSYLGQCKRKVYDCFVNTDVVPVQSNNRKFTTLDMFPTVIASLGAEIEGNRLGLGVNLFSDVETISERMGYPAFFAELQKKSEFYNKKLLYANRD